LPRKDRAAGDVVDIGEVAGLRAVVVERDGRAFINPLDEAEGSHVGPAGGTEYREVAENRDVYPVLVVILP
jgi:hypothetical protein